MTGPAPQWREQLVEGLIKLYRVAHVGLHTDRTVTQGRFDHHGVSDFSRIPFGCDSAPPQGERRSTRLRDLLVPQQSTSHAQVLAVGYGSQGGALRDAVGERRGLSAGRPHLKHLTWQQPGAEPGSQCSCVHSGTIANATVDTVYVHSIQGC